MIRRTRSILFVVMAVVFLVVAPLTVLYSLGWRIDFNAKKIIKVGLFYFQIVPRSSQVYVNDKLEGKTNFLFTSVAVENLLPGKYNVEIKKDGFWSWKKSLEIKEKQATEIKNVVLITQSPNFSVLTKGGNDFYLTPDGKNIVINETPESPPTTVPGRTPTESWALKLFEIKNNVKSRLVGEKDISVNKKGANTLENLKFSPDSKTLFLKIAQNEQLKYYTLEINAIPPVLTPLSFLKEGFDFTDAYFSPRDPQKMFLLNEGNIEELNLQNKQLSPSPLASDVIAFGMSGDNIYYLDKSGFVFKINLIFPGKEKINKIPFPIKEETSYKIGETGSTVVLKEGNALFLFDNTRGDFKKISDFVIDFAFSFDSRKLAYWSDNQVSVLFLQKTFDQPLKQKGELVPLPLSQEKISDVSWWTNNYLLLNENGKIKIVETDDRDKFNIVDLASFPSLSKIFWDRDAKKIYLSENNTIYGSDRLIPWY